jgi:hypothetical protein
MKVYDLVYTGKFFRILVNFFLLWKISEDLSYVT